MVELGPATGFDALNKDDILRQFGAEIDKIIAASEDPTFEYERQVLILQARLNWMFVRNQHFTVPGTDVTPFSSASDWGSYFDPGVGNSQETGADIKLSTPVNIVGANLYRYIGVMAANAPRVKGVPDDVHDPDSIHAAYNADVNIRDIWWKQHVDRQWKTLAFHQYVTGPTYLRVVWNTDRRKYGESVEPQIEIVEGPDGIPLPQVTGQQSYANGDVELRVHTVFDCSHPWEATEISNCGWFTCEVMASKWELLSRFKGKDGNAGPLDKYRDGDLPEDLSASTVAANEAKEATASPSNQGRSKRPNRWRIKEYWLEPYYFEAIENEEVREGFKSHFKDGLYIAKVGNVKVEIDNRNVCDEWTVCRVGRGDKISDRPIASDIVPLNRSIDDLWGLSIETVLRAIPQTIVDNQLLDREAMSTKEAVVGEVILTTMPVDGDVNKRWFQIPAARLSDQVRPIMELARSFMDDISGCRAELAGGGQPTQTFREAKQRKDQALAQLAPQAQAMLEASAAFAENAVKMRAKFGAGTVKAQQKTAYGIKTDVADISQLQEDGWHAEADDQFPMTDADRRDGVYSMLKEFPPEVQQALSILDPLNIMALSELLQIPGFDSKVSEQKKKTLQDIEKLLQEEAIQGPDGKTQPSIPPDSFDAHDLVSMIMQAWLVGNADVRNDRPQNFANVVARYEAEMGLANPPAPPPPPPLKGAVSFTGKLEDFPNLVGEVLEGAGLSAPPPAPPQNPAAPGPMSTPPGIGSGAQENPIPPIAQPPGPQPMPVQ